MGSSVFKSSQLPVGEKPNYLGFLKGSMSGYVNGIHVTLNAVVDSGKVVYVIYKDTSIGYRCEFNSGDYMITDWEFWISSNYGEIVSKKVAQEVCMNLIEQMFK